jgi:ATP-dependent DNA helicase RecG
MLPFTLTTGQREAFKEIVGDMTAPVPMRRLLQGDVGSGKTIVALLAAALALENGYQAVFMAPTEILAEQHIQTIQQHCGHTEFRTAFLTGSLASGERRRVRQQIADGEADLIVGTHALVQEGVSFKKLGLAVIDEQHRFGVMQRAALLEAAAGVTPDLLIMTATPIPRSLTLTLFGDLSVSLISDKPPGRKPVTTAVRTEKDKPKIISFLKKETAAGRQVYWVCNRIADNPDDDIKGVEEVYQQLRKIFGPQRVGLLHGRLPQREREEMMGRFQAGEIKVLAATTVIEVGVNVPNASVMLIENAERFGLSQIHQLRGRVGRGADKSWCILIYNPTASDNAAERLKILEDSDDGFEIAQKDLELRGPGDFFGTRQSGVPTFRVGSLIRDAKLLEEARQKAFSYIASPPRGLEKERSDYIDHLRHQWKQKYGLVLVG